MLDGINILNEIIVYEKEGPSLAVFLTVVPTCVFVGFLLGLCDNSAMEGALMGIIIGIFLGVLVACGITRETNEISYIKYQVTVDDSVLLTEFYENYEIIEQDGVIFTIREKEKGETQNENN